MFLLSLFFSTLLLLHILIRYSRKGRLIHKISGPFSFPIIGNLFDIMNLSVEQMWEFLRSSMNKYFPIAKGTLGNIALVCTADPNYIKIILSCKKNVNKGFLYNPFKAWLKSSVLLASDEKWQQRRKILTPAFHPNILKMYLEVINRHTKNLISCLKSTDDETIQSLFPLLSTFTLNIICESAMGINLNIIEAEEKRKYIKAFDEICAVVSYRITKPQITNWVMKLLSIGRKQQCALSELHYLANKIIQERRKYHECTDYESLRTFIQDDSIITDLVYSNKNKRRGLCLLDILLLAEKDGLIDDSAIEEEVNTFMFGGYDTSKTALVFILMLLAENKEAQTLARAEAVKVLGSSGGEITITELQNFKYIKRCIKESLRLFPSIPHIARSITKDAILDNKYSIPTGTNFGICIFDLHRNPDLWTNPEKFDPDRFLPEHVQNRHPYAHIPFSAGPRNCIGQKFAMMEMISAVAHILHNFYLEPVERTSELTFKFSVCLSTTHPIHVKFIKINKK